MNADPDADRIRDTYAAELAGGPPDLAPAELGRLAVFTDPAIAADQLREWADRCGVRSIVWGWFRTIADELER